MINAARCRAKAEEWADRAERASDGAFKRRHERIARNWTALARVAEADEASEARRRRGGR
jgi:hypothetical protein